MDDVNRAMPTRERYSLPVRARISTIKKIKPTPPNG
jgi:hypothetical protein